MNAFLMLVFALFILGITAGMIFMVIVERTFKNKPVGTFNYALLGIVAVIVCLVINLFFRIIGAVFL